MAAPGAVSKRLEAIEARVKGLGATTQLDDIVAQLDAATAAAKDWAAESEWIPVFPGEPESPLSWRNPEFAAALERISRIVI